MWDSFHVLNYKYKVPTLKKFYRIWVWMSKIAILLLPSIWTMESGKHDCMMEFHMPRNERVFVILGKTIQFFLFGEFDKLDLIPLMFK